jgi:hypothetical protein
MNAPKQPNSSWGQPSDHTDIRALKRYNWLLRKLAFVGEVIVYCLTVLIVIVCGGMLVAGNFENTIFTDGTSMSCMLDGSTGEIVNVK